MGQVFPLFLLDSRLRTEAESAFSDSPVFVEYLAMRIVQDEGSLAVLRFMIEVLKESVPNPDPISLEAVVRLAVDRDGVQTAFLFDELKKTGIDACRLSYRLLFKLIGDIHMDGRNTSEGHTHLHRAVNQSRLVEYLRIFTCALAMLKGLNVDPRAMVAA